MDLAMNLIGTILGFLIFYLLRKIIKDFFINYITLTLIILAGPFLIYAIINTIVHYKYYIPFFDVTAFKCLLI